MSEARVVLVAAALVGLTIVLIALNNALFEIEVLCSSACCIITFRPSNELVAQVCLDRL